MSALSDFHEPMRVILADNDPQQQEFEDTALTAMLRCAYTIGLWPAGYKLTGANVTPDVPIGVVFCQILMESLIAGTVGQQGAYAFRTRAFGETDHGERKRDILQYARQTLYSLRDGDAAFSSRQTLVAFLNTLDSAFDLSSVQVVPPLTWGYDVGAGAIVTPSLPPI